MEQHSDYVSVLAPREGVNDDFVRVLEWLVADGACVDVKQAVAVLETAKSTFEVDAPAAGYLFHSAKAGAEVAVGMPVAVISPTAERPARTNNGSTAAAGHADSGSRQDQVITAKAKTLIEKHSVPLTRFAGLAVVRADDVEQVLRRVEGVQPAFPMFGAEPLDPAGDWDGPSDTELKRQMTALLTSLRKRMRAKFNRHVSTGNLLHDRWQLARDCGFGDGTSVYDDCLILGDVKLGRNCWVGPYTVLDGSGQLTIGDYVDIGAGAHVYSHNTIERALTGHKATLFKKATTIGNCCFIAPKSIIAPGTVIGDHCFVAAGSYVEGVFPSFSYIAGSPAKRVGAVEVRGNRAALRLDPETLAREVVAK